MNTAILKNWGITLNCGGYLDPMLAKKQLHGFICDDSRGVFPDGMRITTSNINYVIDKESCKIVVTRNTHYTIFADEINPEYKKQFPNAYEQLGKPL